MIRILTTADRSREVGLFEQMFRARAEVFGRRLGWEVSVIDGQEYDRYDDLEDTTYVVAESARGHLIGSLRLRPTTGATMLRNEFRDFFGEPVDVVSPTIWECTRFCVHPPQSIADADAARRVSSDLLIGLCELCLQAGIEHIVGVYDNRSTRIYHRIGWAPELLTESHSERGHLRVSLWEASEAALKRMRLIAARHQRAPETRRAA